MYNALLTARKLLSTANNNPLKSTNNSNKDILFKGTELLPSKFFVRSCKSFESYIKLFATPYFHACGTCSMPSSNLYKDNNDNNVVDEELKVIGIKKLRIADASVIPAIPTSPTSAICMAIGLACAELLIEAD